MGQDEYLRPAPGFEGYEKTHSVNVGMAPVPIRHTTFASQLRAMTIKNGIMTIRSPIMLCCQITMPVIILAGLLVPTLFFKAYGLGGDDTTTDKMSTKVFQYKDLVVDRSLLWGSSSYSSSSGNAWGSYVDGRAQGERSFDLGRLNGTQSYGYLGHFMASHGYFDLPSPQISGSTLTWEAIREKMVQDKEALTRTSNSYEAARNANIPHFVFAVNKLSSALDHIEVILGTQSSGDTDITGDEVISEKTRGIGWAGTWLSGTVNAKNNVSADDLTAVNVAPSVGYFAVSKSWSQAYFGAMITAVLVPMAMSFLPIMFVSNIVSEKQNRVVEMMKIMGMSLTAYWFTTWFYFFLLGLVVGAVTMISCVAAGISTFNVTNPAVYILLFILQAASQASSGLFFSNFFQRQKVAILVMYLLVSNIGPVGTILSIWVFKASVAPFWAVLYPHWAFSRGIYLMAAYFLSPGFPTMSFTTAFQSEMVQIYVWLIAETVFYAFLTMYIERVWPREHGVADSPLYPIYGIMSLFKGRKTGSENIPLLAGGHGTEPHDDNIVVKVRDLKKHFSGKKALDGLTLDIPMGECLGLLGPNGAGKSTLAHLLCGLAEPTSGHATVSGYDIRTDMPSVRTVLGLCPQHEIVWDDLTVAEHLLFYLRLKNVPSNYELYESDRILSSVGLFHDKDKKSTQLSGGMKRRLSIAISLVGNPKCLILDEPTTGLDPDTRRSVWDMIQSQKAGRAIILTTHNMEEADTLSTRIAIVSRGNLVCIGNQLELKKRYGKGYKLSINPRLDSTEQAKGYIMSLFPSATIDTVSAGTLSFYIPTGDVDISALFREMTENKDKHGIVEWGVSQASLEEVFIKVVETDEMDEQTN